MTLLILPEDFEDNVSEFKQLLSAVAACSRRERLYVIELLDEAVEEELISQLDADDILLEWDVNNWPEQLPKPVVEYVRNNKPYRLLRPRAETVEDDAQLTVVSFGQDDGDEP